MNRKLVRPNLAEIKERLSAPRPAPVTPAPIAVAPSPPTPHAPRPNRDVASSNAANAMRRRPVPPEQTSAEAFYYLKQMNGHTPMVVVLDNDEQLRGHIEWYDRGCIKVNREDGPNLLVFKHSIKYLYKQEEETGSGGAPSNGGSSE